MAGQELAVRCSTSARARLDAVHDRGLVRFAGPHLVARLRTLRAALTAGEQRQRGLQRHAPGFIVGRARQRQRARAALVGELRAVRDQRQVG